MMFDVLKKLSVSLRDSQVIYNFIAPAEPESDQGVTRPLGLAWLDTMIRKILNVNKQTLRILPVTVQCHHTTLL